MSAETVTTKIEEKANNAAAEILSTAEKEAEKVREDILTAARAREDKIIKTAERNAEITKKGILQSAKQSANLLLLKTKRDSMDKVKDEAKKKILALPDKEMTALFVNQMKKSELSGEFTIFPAPCHRALLKKNLSELEKGVGIKITLADSDGDIDTGFLLSSEIYEVDFSLDAIIDEAFERNEKIIHDTLFEGERE